MAAMIEMLEHPLVLLVLGAVIGAAGSSIGWLVKRKSERAGERRQFLESRIEPRDAGFAKIMAAANAFQFLKADGHVDDDALGEVNLEDVVHQAFLLFDEGTNEVRANVGSLEPFQHVTKYLHWVFIADHEPMMAPGVEEFNRIAELITSCKRVYQEEDRIAVLRAKYALGEGHDYKSLVESAVLRHDSIDGTVTLGLQGPELADWLEGIPARNSAWLVSRSQCYRRMRKSGLFDEIPALTLSAA